MSTDTLEKEETETPLAIDPSTGLPVLPEDMFWRVDDVTRREYSGWGREYEDINEPNVQLVKTVQKDKTRKVPDTHGKNWWNRNVVITMKDETYQVREQVVQAQASTMGLAVQGRKNVPEKAINVRADHYSYNYTEPEDGEEDTNIWRYDLPLTEDTIKHLAGRVWRAYLESEHDSALEEDRVRTRALEKARDEAAKERLYGDYPPKTLVDA